MRGAKQDGKADLTSVKNALKTLYFSLTAVGGLSKSNHSPIAVQARDGPHIPNNKVEFYRFASHARAILPYKMCVPLLPETLQTLHKCNDEPLAILDIRAASDPKWPWCYLVTQ